MKSIRHCITFYIIIFSILLSLPAFSQNELKKRGFLGVQVVDITEEIQKEVGLPSKEGVMVKGIFPDTTASEAEIKEKDIILEVNETKIFSVQQFVGILADFQAGDEMRIIILRGNEKITKEFNLKPVPKETSPDFDIIYTSVALNDTQLRVIITKPRGMEKYPAILFIPGLACISVDYPFDYYPNPYKSVLYELTKKGFVTMRVEKSGMGDSGGPNCREVDFNTETEGFLKGLELLKTFDFVDTDNIFIFGHSMGGIMAPIIAAKIPVKGIIVYGTVSKIWTEYEMENTRRQEELAGTDFVELEKFLREKERFLYHFYIEKLSPEEIAGKDTCFEKYFDDESHIYGRHYRFLQQLYDINIAQEWSSTDSYVLSIWGEGDFVASRGDHELIADIVNRYHPGKGTYLQMKNIDHGFSMTPSMEKSFNREYEEGFNPQIIEEIYKWLTGILQ